MKLSKAVSIGCESIAFVCAALEGHLKVAPLGQRMKMAAKIKKLKKAFLVLDHHFVDLEDGGCF